MPATVELKGRAAAPGLAHGPVHRIVDVGALHRKAGTPGDERDALVRAIEAATINLGDLIAGADADGAAILEFQVAMLEDDALRDPALAAIDRGVDAASAWTDALAAQIADYRGSDDAYFSARASDLEDLRDRVLAQLFGAATDAEVAPGAILIGRDLTPSRFLAIDWSHGGAIALAEGSPSSHVAILARSRGVPMTVGLGPIPDRIFTGAIVDGEHGRLLLDPDADDMTAFAAARTAAAARRAQEATVLTRPALTANGVSVAVHINVAEPEQLDALDPAICDGIGLVRTEFLFSRPGGLPDEATQYRAYARIVDWAAGRPVTIRTIDAGGDKPVPGLTEDGESNPFLGLRGVRLSLAKPDIFKVQLRALARAAVHGPLKIMLPMITVPEEITAAAALLDAAVAELQAEGIAARRPLLGIMVEVPAVAVVPELFKSAAFFSIGSNDLTQYVTASARDVAAVAALNNPGHPAVTALIRHVVDTSRKLGLDVSLCGDMGGDPQHLPALIGAGLRSVSVAPPLVGRVKLALRDIATGGPA
ncbi:phosphoenolpyruvate--protein phosphotransferase [Bradyrhizobium sp. U87765 SZCCT0131]|uniref:phosphoenolpyruvate--protein phosphotransferase n=1 Tax=unclassified Bradyrhizobium TaxID=2631580 RepID=UPI001BA4E8BC|nr:MULTISPECIES: phosphoenolpyruvate--protein phosphotransferase [unclassified Bradyrhizobium]MBR1217443.1 phosphoenolpyruvate--protein phosphotransferase [Bradyrhizobium sp. U87765 SZCCT0131]MBR1264960.1 phosphoenolpyruvate--protein phosphotransferase [Bradyrhizobium sp. U87765 SZCCT0134]MBR1304942.1 phosphoenolpyruvate--protein phosphotransferase [Bradyrhizobium sp. U87765 SZCCT0110]MBR1320728.1 phosphoenolpyruvate--protein phosphotransferase [Bradyrhizobium sp. U87765 SZCCT0109]MBR1349148.1